MFKRVGRPVIIFTLIIIAAITYLAAYGISYRSGDNRVILIPGAQDIRLGIDIHGGVDVTLKPEKGTTIKPGQMDAAKAKVELRLDSLNITDHEIYLAKNANQIIVRFPYQAHMTDPEKTISELGAMAQLSFKDPDGNVILTGDDVKNATSQPDTENGTGYEVLLNFNASGTKKFADATTKLVGKSIGIYMDTTQVSAPVVQEAITGGQCVINNTGNPMSAAEAKSLADKINAGALPFSLVTDNYSTITPTLGAQSLWVMVMAGLIAFILICIFMISYYRLPGFIACLALCGHIAGTLLAISIPHFTLTLPGIAGIILSIGMGVDCNVITGERIREELRAGKTLDGAIDAGFERSFTAIFDGNVTVIIVGVILWTMGSATVKSFGYTLVWGVVFNFLMGIIASRLMLKSVSKYSPARKTGFYSGRVAQ